MAIPLDVLGKAVRSEHLTQAAWDRAYALLRDVADRLREAPRAPVLITLRNTPQFTASEVLTAVRAVTNKDRDFWSIIVVHAKRQSDNTLEVKFRAS